MKKLVLFTFLLLFTVNTFAQGIKEKRERIKSLKVAFITTELDLSSEESAKFWPIYNAFDDEEFEIKHKKMRKLIHQLDDKGLDTISEKEALNYLNQLSTADKELFNLKQKLITDLKTVISPVKILKLKKAETDFDRKLLSKYKERRRNKN